MSSCIFIRKKQHQLSVFSFAVHKNNKNPILEGDYLGIGREKRMGLIRVFFSLPIVILARILAFFVLMFVFCFLKKGDNKCPEQRKWWCSEAEVGWREVRGGLGVWFRHRLYVWKFYSVLVVPFVLFICFLKRERKKWAVVVSREWIVGQ